MLTYSLDNTRSEPLYEQIYKYIREDILSGALKPDARLPSKRGFAENLGVSTVTVENAYAQLLAEGYIYSVQRKGYFVSDIIGTVNRTGSLAYESKAAPEVREKYIADFTSNRTSQENFPFSVWTKVTRRVMSEKVKELMEPSPCQGIYELRRAISGMLLQFRGINVPPERIIVGAGTEYLYGLLIQLLGYDRIYAVEDPGYKKAAQIFESHGVRCRHIPLDENGISITELIKSKAQIVHVSPSHHFPTGIVTPAPRRYELLNWAYQDSERYIIEDDYDSEFRFAGKPVPSMQSIDNFEKVIYMNTFSKSLTPTIRISYMVLPYPLMEKFREKLGFYSCTVSNFEQYTLSKFIEDGYFEKHINRMRNFYHKVRDLILEDIEASPLNGYVNISEENSGLHFLMHVDTGLKDDELRQRALRQGIKISCLSQYYHNPAPEAENILIINYSNINPGDISGITEKMCRILAPEENKTSGGTDKHTGA